MYVMVDIYNLTMRLVHHPDPVCYYCVLGGHVFALVATMARTVCRSQQIAPWRHPVGAGEEEGSPGAGTRAQGTGPGSGDVVFLH